MSADDRRTLGFLLKFYVDTGDSIRNFPNPSVFYSGNIAVSTITAAGQATITAIGSVIQKGQLFFLRGGFVYCSGNCRYRRCKFQRITETRD